MKEFLKFKSVGGAVSVDVTQPGTYYLPIDNILLCQTGGNGLQIWQCASLNLDPTGSAASYYDIVTSNASLDEDTVAAFNEALAANPGGKGIEVQLPAGQTITGWSFTTIGVV